MSDLKKVPGIRAIEIFELLGFSRVAQRGRHVMLSKQLGGESRACVVPLQPELKVATLRMILRQADIDPDVFADRT